MRIQLRLSLVRAHVCPPCNGAHVSVKTSLSGWKPPSCPVSEPGDCFTPELLRYSRRYCKSPFVGSRYAADFQFAQYLDLAHFNRSTSRNERNCTSLSTVILTYRRWMWPFAHGAQQRYRQSGRQNNTIGARMECTCHTVLFRKYRCAAEHPCLYVLNPLFPSISRYKRSHTRADKQDCNPNDDPIFSPTHFHSVK